MDSTGKAGALFNFAYGVSKLNFSKYSLAFPAKSRAPLCLLMNIHLNKIASELESSGILFKFSDDRILVELPNDFGTLEITICKNDEDSIQLLNGDFHTHGDLEAVEKNISREQAIRELIEEIFSGELLLIEECESGKKPRRIIENSLDHYLKYLPEGTTYKIFNKT